MVGWILGTDESLAGALGISRVRQQREKRGENRSLEILKALEEGEGNIQRSRNGNAFVVF